jgi:secondary thiamine-phosphate synthase enzyme
MKIAEVRSSKRIEAINISSIINNYIRSVDKKDGLCIIYTPHTTSAIIINEGFDPDVMSDFISHTSSLVPYNKNYRHVEGNSDAHIKAAIIGNSRIVPFENGRLLLGRWEAVFFLEFDGPRNRKVYIKLV